jgi:hypothetical protein
MYVVMMTFSNLKIPAIIFATRDRALEYVRDNESVFCTYEIKYVDYGG